jgi:hypothetical protein
MPTINRVPVPDLCTLWAETPTAPMHMALIGALDERELTRCSTRSLGRRRRRGDPEHGEAAVMSVVPPRAPLEAERSRPPAPLPAPPAAPPEPAGPPRPAVPLPAHRVSVERIVLGVLLGAAGVAWLLAQVEDVRLQWSVAAPVALVLLGLGLLVTTLVDTHLPGGSRVC